jgi:hypothetical protein
VALTVGKGDQDVKGVFVKGQANFRLYMHLFQFMVYRKMEVLINKPLSSNLFRQVARNPPVCARIFLAK